MRTLHTAFRFARRNGVVDFKAALLYALTRSNKALLDSFSKGV